jgi:hypothetical protein
MVFLATVAALPERLVEWKTGVMYSLFFIA